MTNITIIGAGLAGTETAFQLSRLARLNNLELKIKLYEMRPMVNTPAHHTANFAELVCSNSLGSEFLTTARGVLIQEMKIFESLIVDSAIKSKVPAGQALAVDRDKFAELVSLQINQDTFIQVVREEVKSLSCDGLDFLVIASGPLTSPSLAEEIQKLTQGKEFLNFFDAASPILTADSVNMDIAFKASRYGKGSGDDYINCPFYKAEDYYRFHEALIEAERAELQDLEKENLRYFEGCMPVEAIAERGRDTLRFGPLKPVGLSDPRREGEKPFAVVQLRQDNVVGSLYNIVGFQTNLKWGEQKRVFSMIPGLENIEIVRYGVMHQNIFLNSPVLLAEDLSLKTNPQIYFAGQITGVEGYTESAATGIVVAKSIVSKLLDAKNKAVSSSAIGEIQWKPFPQHSMIGALVNYVANADPKRFQPINSNWGLINPNPDELEKKIRKNKKLKNEYLAERALSLIREYAAAEASAMVNA